MRDLGLALKPVEKLEVIVLVDNVVDFSGAVDVEEGASPRSWAKGGNPEFIQSGHGLSLLVRTYVEDQVHEIVYDAGPSEDILEHNVRALGLELKSVDAVVMSHGHWDHFGGLKWLLREVGRSNVPIYLHPRMLAPRRVVTETPEGQKIWTLPPIPTLDEVKRWGGAPEIISTPVTLAGDTLLRTGEIPRKTSYEIGMPGHQALIDGSWVDDSLVIDDSSLVANVAKKGVVLLTGCAHSGVVNSAREALRLTGAKKLHAIIGGIHLIGSRDDKIKDTLRDLDALKPRVVACGHCTGWKAQHYASSLFKGRYVQSSSGLKFSF